MSVTREELEGFDFTTAEPAQVQEPAFNPLPTVTADNPLDLILNQEYETDRNDITGFWPSLKAGFDNLYTSAVRVPAALLSEGVTQLVEEYSPELGAQMRADTDGFLRGPEGEKKDLSITMERASKAPTSDTLRALGRSDDVDSFISTFMDSDEKWTVVKEVLGLSLPSTLGIAASTVYGGLPATFASSYVMDWGNSYVESRAAGKEHNEAAIDASTKALVQAGLDTAAMGIGGVQLHANKMINILEQSTVQALAGGGAEWAKHEAVDEETTTGQILIEGLAEFALGPLEVFSRNQDLSRRKAAQDILKLYEEKLRLDPKEVAAVRTAEQLQKLDEQLNKIVLPAAEDIPSAFDNIDELTGSLDFDTFDLQSTIENMSDVRLLESTFTNHTDMVAWSDNLENFLTYINEDNQSVPVKDSLMVPGKAYMYDDMASVDQQLIEWGLELDALKSNLSTVPVERTLQEEHIKDYEDMINKWKSVRDTHKDLQHRVRGAVQELMDKFNLKENIIITFGQAAEQFNATMQDNPREHLPDTSKAMSGYAGYVRLVNKDTWIMGVNPHNIGADYKGTIDFAETIAHEFGHALMISKYESLQPKQQLAVLAAYRNWLKQFSNGEASYEDFINATRGPRTAESMLQDNDEQTVLDYMHRTGRATYAMGLNEFLAHQFERLSAHKSVSPVFKKYFKDVLPQLKDVHKVSQEKFGVQQDFQTFLNHMLASDAYLQARNALTQKEQTRVDQVIDQRIKDRMNGITKKVSGFEDTTFKNDMNNALDSYNLLYKYGAGLTHLAKDNPHIKGLQRYIKTVKGWWNEKMRITSDADETLKSWSKYVGIFNKDKKGDLFSKFLLDLTVKSFDAGKRFAPESAEFQQLVNRYNIDEAGLELYLRIDKDFQNALNDLEAGLEFHIQRNFKDDPVMLNEQLNKLTKEMADLRNRNFFPLSRFGKHYVHIKANSKQTIDKITYNKGETISFTTFDKKSQARALYGRQKNNSNYIVQMGVLSDFQQQFAGIPPDLISMLKDKLNLTDEQQKELNLFLTERAPGQSYKKHMLHRKQTKGFSQDAMRAYANYFMHFSNHVAKVKHSKVMEDAIADVQKTLPFLPGDATKRQQIVDHLQKHKEYILNPGNELANLRALGFLWYLGFVPKSAVVNLTQVPMVTYPYLASRYGDAEAVNAIAKATTTFTQTWKHPEKVDIEIISMLEELKKRGIIDESMATELAATAEGSVVQKFAPSWASNPRAHRYIRTMAGWGALMFQTAEKANRRITAIAAFTLAKKRGYGFEGALDQAERAVESTQYEYARWNRPFFTQKKRSVFFLFWMYRTNAMHFLLKDPGASRYLLMLFLTAGLAGLPFSEDIMDLYDWMARKLNKQLGEDTAPVDIRLELRELMQAINANPDLMMHGASRYMFGLPAAADMVGVPLANADMSGSLSMGRMIPGVGGAIGQEGNYGESFSRGAEELGGAVLAIPFSLMKAIADDNPDTMKRFERALPSFARNFSKAYRYWNDKADKTSTGAELVEFDLQDWQHRAEIVQQALGFAPTRVQVEKEKYWMTKELVTYYTTRRQLLMQNFDYTRRQNDLEGEQYIRDKIKDFNKEVPIKGFRITGNDLLQSVKRRRTERRKIERGRYTPDRGRALQRRMDQSFSVEELESLDFDPTVILEEVEK